MADKLVQIADGFWNIRGSFKIALLDIGTQASLVRLASGRFVLLGGYTLRGAVLEQVEALTDKLQAIDAVVHLHPFHTVHVKPLHAQLPDARLYGTARHVDKAPELPWEDLRADDPELCELFGGEFWFTVPRGLRLVTPDPKVHAGSVLALHRPSRTLHVDDTLTHISLPLVGGLRFHPTSGKALEERAGAAEDFRQWAEELATACADVDHLVTAHMRTLPDLQGPDQIGTAVRTALSKLDGSLHRHARRWG